MTGRKETLTLTLTSELPGRLLLDSQLPSRVHTERNWIQTDIIVKTPCSQAGSVSMTESPM
jgi:hypothetical protein